MSNIVMPKNSALEPEIKAVLEIYSSQSAPGWMDSSEYTPLLKAKIGDDQYASSYPKKAQIPSYFGLVEWMDKDNNKSPRRITERGRAFFDAWEKEDFTLMHSLILEALETTSFGRDNSGSPSSRSDVQPPCLCIRLILDLGYITTNEFAYVLWQIADKFNGYTESLNEIKRNRAGEISLDFSSLPNSYLDAKPITFLKNIRFLETSDNELVLNSAVKSSYENRLKNLKVYVIDNNVTLPLIYRVSKSRRSFNHPRQRIIYGAPGTGKSFGVENLSDNSSISECFRTTFHPDSDYSTFVGAYKPVMEEGAIAYKFRPQAFINAYVKAWEEMGNKQEDGSVRNVVLVIEEINRGNCAQIFGDLFQLLDRGNSGYSSYPIDADADLAAWLEEEKGKRWAKIDGLSKPDDIRKEEDWKKVKEGKKLALPPNLYIWATMNTSDQSLFPMDSAFKRRWDWKYVPISEPDKEGDATWEKRKIQFDDKLFDWWDFVQVINGYIKDTTGSEDKQLGYFFVKADDTNGYISADTFVNKVLFYLYGDVFKAYPLPECFVKEDKELLAFTEFFYDQPVKDGRKKEYKPGDVKLDVLKKFLENIEYKGKRIGSEDGNKNEQTSSSTETSLGASSDEEAKNQ